MCYMNSSLSKGPTKAEIKLGIESEVLLAKELDDGLLAALASNDIDRLIDFAKKINREGGITWRLRQIISNLMESK